MLVLFATAPLDATLKAARAAGCDRVLPRSQFVEELPAELRDKAREADETSIPDYFILTERVPAPENVDVFGQYQKPGQRLVVGDKGMPPVVPKIRHVRKLY